MTRSFITIGAGPGIGIEIARRFGRAGYAVGIVRRNSEALNSMLSTLRSEGVSAAGVSADAHDPAALRGAIDELAEKQRGIDVLHHAVPGPLGMGYGPMIDVDPDLLRTFTEARVVSALIAAQAGLAYLRKSRGALLYTSGSAGNTAYPNTGIVGVPQAALRMLTEHLRAEMAADGIFVGLLPVAGVPAYRDPQEDAARTDLGLAVPLVHERLSAADVAEAHYRLAMARDRHEWVIGNEEQGIGSD